METTLPTKPLLSRRNILFVLGLAAVLQGVESKASNCNEVWSGWHETLFDQANYVKISDFQSEQFKATHKLLDVVSLTPDLVSGDVFQASLYTAENEIAGSSTLIVSHGSTKLGQFTLAQAPKKMWFTKSDTGEVELEVELDNGTVSRYFAWTNTGNRVGLDAYQNFPKQISEIRDGSAAKQFSKKSADTSTGQQYATIRTSSTPEGTASYYMDQHEYALILKENGYELRDFPGGLHIKVQKIDGVSGLAASRSHLAIVQNKNMIHVWELDSSSQKELILGNQKSRFYSSLDDPFTDVEILDGNILLTKTQSGNVKLVDLSSGKLIETFYASLVKMFQVSRNGVIGLVGMRGNAQLFRVVNGVVRASKEFSDARFRKIISVSAETVDPVNPDSIMDTDIFVTFGLQNGDTLLKRLNLDQFY